MDLCSKPSCARPGAAVLSFDYSAATAVLDDPPDKRPSPHAYVLCSSCAERLRPPVGWQLDDRRLRPPLFVGRTPVASDRLEGLAGELDEPEGSQLLFGYGA